jgi:hypothetical protein
VEEPALVNEDRVRNWRLLLAGRLAVGFIADQVRCDSAFNAGDR